MYERFYNLRERPFALSPDPDYLYPSRGHQEALNYLRYGIETQAGFIVITGEIGSGKTTLLQATLRRLDHQTALARLVSTTLDARELVEAVMLDFGLDPGLGRSKPYLIRDLARFLVEQRSAGRLALLVIDEAQNLSPSALEEIRMLSNLETEKSKLIQIVLIGQPNLRELLSQPALEQLRQRVTVSYHLRALDSVETAAYINHRLRRAAIGAPLEFSRDVTDLIHLHSGGVPRKINVIADAVLLFGFGDDRRVVTVDLTHEALQELEGTGVIPSPSTGAVTIAPPAAVSADALRAREERLVERERKVAQSERLVAEEYRRLQQLREQAAIASHQPAREPWPPSRPAVHQPPAPLGHAAGAPPPPVRPMRDPALTRQTSVSPAEHSVQSTTPPASPRDDASRPPLADPNVPRRASAPAATYLRAPQPSRASRVEEEPNGMWARLRRGLFGVQKPVFEE
jgi:putative secretion ATPase (PEP-CTERM system associated)